MTRTSKLSNFRNGPFLLQDEKKLNERHYVQTHNRNNKNKHPNHTTKPINYKKTTTFWIMMPTNKQASELGLELSSHASIYSEVTTVKRVYKRSTQRSVIECQNFEKLFRNWTGKIAVYLKNLRESKSFQCMVVCSKRRPNRVRLDK